MRVRCLYCDVENDALATAGYCDSCGKKLPSSAMVRTRRSLASESSGDADPADTRLRAPTAEALATAAVVQLAAGGLFLVLGPALFREVPPAFLSLVVLFTVVPATGLGVLGWAAARRPRPAALAAVIGYVVWAVGSGGMYPEMAWAWLVVHAVVGGALGWVIWVSGRSPVRGAR